MPRQKPEGATPRTVSKIEIETTVYHDGGHVSFVYKDGKMIHITATRDTEREAVRLALKSLPLYLD